MPRHIAVLTTFEGNLPFRARLADDGAKVPAAQAMRWIAGRIDPAVDGPAGRTR